MKGPAIFLAQFAGDAAPFNSLRRRSRGWAAALGYKGVQIPTWDARLFDLEKAARSQDLLRRGHGHRRAGTGVEITELSTHLQGQLVAVHPGLRRRLRRLRAAAGARQPEGAAAAGRSSRCMAAAKASQQSRPDGAASRFSGALAWPYPLSLAAAPAGPDRDRLRRTRASAGSRSSTPSTRPASTSATRSIRARTCYDGVTFEMFLERVGNHPRCGINYDPSHFVLQQLDYLDFIDIYHERITRFHVKDAEFNPTGRQGVYSRLSSPGSTAPAASARSATARSISRRSSPSSRSTTTTAGRCSNGNAASSTPRTARARARRSSRDHIIRVTEQGVRRLRRRRGDATQGQPAGMLGLELR